MSITGFKRERNYSKKREIRAVEHWFSATLLSWYSKNKRDLPWRNSKNPYRIWLSEVILQQTQVKQGLSYYLNFVKQYPSVQKLAAAKEDEVLKLWQGLGYYSRARNLHQTAKLIQQQYRGKFPGEYIKIRALKGVGDYTAAAIASFAFDLPYAVVDGNVYRVLSRVFGIKEAVDSGMGKKIFFELAQDLLPKNNAALHNQAIMEFGSVYCKPKNPECSSCIFSDRCIAYRKGWVERLPFKSKKTLQKTRYFYYSVFIDLAGNTMIRKRDGTDIWKGLYEFPLTESQTELTEKKLYKIFGTLSGSNVTKKKVIYESGLYKHQLSHQNLMARFYVIHGKFQLSKDFKKVKWDGLSKFAVPRLIHKFLIDWESREKNYI